jgi:hypothetical protein
MRSIGQDPICTNTNVSITEIANGRFDGITWNLREYIVSDNDKVIANAMHFMKRDINRHPG